MSILAIDVGTTCIKCQVLNTKGESLARSSREYDVKRKNGVHEINISALTTSLFDIMAEVCVNLDDLVEGICVSSLGESFVPIGYAGEVLADSMLYSDRRGEKECVTLVNAIPKEKIVEICGVKPHCMYSLPKMMWIKENDINLYNRTHKFLSIGDYIYFLLTGMFVTDYSLASRTLAFDIENKCWSDLMLDAAKIDKDKLPNALPSGSVVGAVTKKVEEQYNLSEKCKVITGGHDQICAAVGAGIINVGECNDGTGTVECMSILFDTIPTNESFYDDGYCVVPYVTCGKYMTYAFNFTGGALLKWFRDKIVPQENALIKNEGNDLYDYYCKNISHRPSNLLTLPHFLGSATPYMDSCAKGGIVGLTLEHNGFDVFASLMEGATYEMRVNLKRLENYGVRVNELTATGGGAKSSVWLEIKADILRRKVSALSSNEGGIAGCFILAVAALGYFESVEKAIEIFVKKRDAVTFDDERASNYDELFVKYEMLYECLKKIGL